MATGLAANCELLAANLVGPSADASIDSLTRVTGPRLLAEDANNLDPTSLDPLTIQLLPSGYCAAPNFKDLFALRNQKNREAFHLGKHKQSLPKSRIRLPPVKDIPKSAEPATMADQILDTVREAVEGQIVGPLAYASLYVP
jgi:hypothetical protein